MSIVPQHGDEVQVAPAPTLLPLLISRAFAEYSTLVWSKPFCSLPHGDHHPVLALPGFGVNDLSTQPMRQLLRAAGYRTYGWQQGCNLGMRDAVWTRLRQRLQSVAEWNGGRRVSLIGWSLGGVYARELAREWPDLVRQVITMGSPINAPPVANHATTPFWWINHHGINGTDCTGFQCRREPPPVPCTAIYSRSDGIIAWRCAIEKTAPNTENIEVHASHIGFGFNPQVMRVLAKQLARTESELVRKA